ncbi:MAG: transcriptional regulator GcvA [Alphaproteobacteria bacterium]|nr:MAG: transcriptional regulator GcvA [Alphaproteobacteria bacterium]
MARHLPPLNALRAFEAAARHLSFTKAAEELHVTQAAISHQVRALEEVLGVTLFRRFNRRLMLSDAGQQYLPQLSEAFDQIDAATQRLRSEEDHGILKVSVANSFAAKWLLPRMPRFYERHPDLDVQISASDRLTDFTREDIDMGIRYGRGHYPGLHVEMLMDDLVLPVCSPRLLEGPRPLRTPADLRYHTLLHDEVAQSGFPDWRQWLIEAGVTGVNPDRGPRYSHASLVIQAAIDGQGVALTRTSLVSLDIEAGRLISPFGPILSSNFACYVVAPPSHVGRPKVKAFRDWLFAQIAHERSGADGPHAG